MVSTCKLAELWQRMGYRVVVVCMSGKTEVKEISGSLKIYGVKDFFLKDPFNYGIAPFFCWHVFKALRAEKPAIIAANKILFWSSLSVFFLRALGKRVILLSDVLAGYTWWWRSKWVSFCGLIYARTIGWLVLRSAWQVVLFHPQPEKLMKSLRLIKKSRVIPTGIDPSVYKYDNQNRSSDSHNVSVAYVGRLESVKGVDDFLKAAVQVKKDYPDIKIKVTGWYKKGHPLVAKYQDKAEFTGLRKDIPEILHSTDIFVLPSYSEGLSNALMEAMSSGCACIASQTGGNCYLIENGVSGFLFDPGDTQALSAHLKRLIEDPAKRISLGHKARERIVKNFSWEVIGKEYQRLFEQAEDRE